MFMSTFTLAVHEISLSKTVCYHFWRGLMALAEICRLLGGYLFCFTLVS
jgi:hypothetical protein